MASVTQMIRRRRTRKERRAIKQATNRNWTLFITVLLTIFIGLPLIVFLGGAAIIYAQAAANLPNPAETTFVGSIRGVTQLYDNSGQFVIYTVQDPLGDEREWVTLDELPPYLIDATLLVEDPNFLETAAFNPLVTVMELWQNMLVGPIRPNPSITGRLVRNAIAPPPDFVTVEDRNREIALVSEINRRYPPRAVLEWHLNTNYYGNEAYGIEAAAQVYMGKSARELTLDEAVMLAAIPTAPQFNPIDDETAARGRQSDALRRMSIEGLINAQQYEEANRAFTLILRNTGQFPDLAPDFAFYARRQAETILDNIGFDGERMISRGGVKITTTLDTDLYYQTECALRAHLNRLSGDLDAVQALNGADCIAAQYLPAFTPTPDEIAPDSGQIVVIDVQTGEIKAMVGAATEYDYQPGMTLAPFVYFEGFREARQNQQYTPASMLLDIPQRFPGAVEGLIYQPVNLDGQFSGPISLRESAATGLLPPTVQVADNHGLNAILRTSHRLGINSLSDGIYDLSLLERGGTVSVLDMGYAYSVLASMGDMYGVEVRPRGTGFRNRDPVAVTRIEDADGRVLWEYAPEVSRVNVFSSFRELGYLVNDIYADNAVRVTKFGANNPLNVERPAAIVNTVTSNQLDNWTIGYTPFFVTAVHLDRADATPFRLSGYGLSGAAPVWRAVTEYTHIRASAPAANWERPQNVVERVVCQISGMLPNDICPTRREVFINAFVPTASDTFWQSIEINSQTRQRASVNTPAALRVNETYFIPPDDALNWWRANNLPLPPTDYDVLSQPDNNPFSTTALTRPEQLAWLRGAVEIRGVVSETDFAAFQLRYGEGAINPQQWFNIGQRSTTLPADGLLGVWDTTGLDGVYTVELTVEDSSGRRERDVVQVRVDNIPPAAILSAGEAGKIYRWPAETIIPLSADVSDNLAIDRVEFYNNGRLIFTDDDAPYSYDYGITGIGTERFYSIAYDAAGNSNVSNELSVEIAR